MVDSSGKNHNKQEGSVWVLYLYNIRVHSKLIHQVAVTQVSMDSLGGLILMTFKTLAF